MKLMLKETGIKTLTEKKQLTRLPVFCTQIKVGSNSYIVKK